MSTTTQNSASQRRRVHYVFNNQEVPRLTIRQLFDTRRFSRLTAVTGELDADFFNQHLSDFIQIEIALGAPEQTAPQTADETATKGALTTALMAAANKQPARLFEALSGQNQLNVLNGLYTVEQAPVQAIHSRFYLLSDDTGAQTRVILGSINLTAASFDEHHNQLEEVLVFDNSPLYANFMQRFKNDLKPVLKNYFSTELLSAAQKTAGCYEKGSKSW